MNKPLTFAQITERDTRNRCRAWDQGSPCENKAYALSTDVAMTDPLGYHPVCQPHLQQAIKRGLERSAVRPAGYRLPIMILPLDDA